MDSGVARPECNATFAIDVWASIEYAGYEMTETRLTQATLGGGCFWCLEAVFQELEGVVRVESGYAGGTVERPTYAQVCTGTTGHAEVVRVTFDAARLQYHELLDVFFAIHDPTTQDRQGNDVGTQYRSVVFWHDEAQRQIAQATIAEHARDLNDPIVTQLLPAGAFYPAEAEHQTYYTRHGEQPYCRVVIAPKLAKFRAKFAARRKTTT